jgi:hypothetical protein
MSAWRLAFVASCLTLLAGCAGVQIVPNAGPLPSFGVVRHVLPEHVSALDAAPSCCASLAALDWRAIEREGTQRIDLGPGAPAFDFETGRSFHAAFRLPDWPRPLEVRVTGRAAGSPLLGVIDSNRPSLNPALLLLDAGLQPRRLLQEPEALRVIAYGQAAGGPEVQVRGTVLVSEPPAEAGYLVVLTTDALRARSVTSSGLRLEGFSPVGVVELEVRSVPFVRPPLLLRSQAALPGAVPGLAGLRPGSSALFVHDGGLHLAELVQDRYRVRVAIPWEHVAQARVVVPFLGDARLEIDIAADAEAPLQRQSILLFPERGESPRTLESIVPTLAARIRPGWHATALAVSARPNLPEVEFRDPPLQRSPAGSRVVDAALAGGLLTASVCGVCGGGLCPPEVLVPCAGLFALGAVVGTAVGIGGEVLRATGPGQGPSASPPTASGANAAEVAGRIEPDRLRFGPEALKACVDRAQPEGEGWVEQGRRASLVDDPARARYTLEVAVDRMALVPRRRAGEAAGAPGVLPVALRSEGTVVLVHRPSGARREARAAWEGAARPLEDWTRPGMMVAEAEVDAACVGLGRALLEAGQTLWRSSGPD